MLSEDLKKIRQKSNFIYFSNRVEGFFYYVLNRASFTLESVRYREILAYLTYLTFYKVHNSHVSDFIFIKFTRRYELPVSVSY